MGMIFMDLSPDLFQTVVFKNTTEVEIAWRIQVVFNKQPASSHHLSGSVAAMTAAVFIEPHEYPSLLFVGGSAVLRRRVKLPQKVLL